MRGGGGAARSGAADLGRNPFRDPHPPGVNASGRAPPGARRPVRRVVRGAGVGEGRTPRPQKPTGAHGRRAGGMAAPARPCRGGEVRGRRGGDAGAVTAEPSTHRVTPSRALAATVTLMGAVAAAGRLGPPRTMLVAGPLG